MVFINKLVKIWNTILDWAAGAMTERYSAVHTACRLLVYLVRCERQVDFFKVLYPFLYRAVSDFLAFMF